VPAERVKGTYPRKYVEVSGGGGGTSDHAALSHLTWSTSAHTGTASRLAWFDSGGGASYLSLGTGLTTSGSSLVVDTGTIATVASLAGYQPLNAALTSISGGTWAGSASITTLGTIVAGTWQGSTLGIGYGGTGSTTQSGARTALGLAIGSNVQAWDADLDALAALGNGLPYRSGGVWSANALGDLAISGASVQVTQARGLRETSGPTTIPIGTIRDGEFLTYSGGVITSAAVNAAVFFFLSEGFDDSDIGGVLDAPPNIIAISDGSDL